MSSPEASPAILPMTVQSPMLMTMPLAVLAEAMAWPMGLLIASVSGMMAGALFANLTGESLMEAKG